MPLPDFQERLLNAGTFTKKQQVCHLPVSVCHGQEQYSVLGLFTRHWINKIKTETDHLQICLCKHLTVCTCPAHRKGSHWIQTDQAFGKKQTAGGLLSHRNAASLLYALSHTRSHKRIFTPCSLWDWKNCPEPSHALRSVAQSPKQPAAYQNASFKAPLPFATEGR